MPVSKENVKSVTIRLPVSLYDELAGEATENRRSLSQQIIFVLEQRKPKIVYRGTRETYSTNQGGTSDNPD